MRKAVEFTIIETWDVNPDNCVPYDGVAFYTSLIVPEKADEFQANFPEARRDGLTDVPEEFILFEDEYMSEEQKIHEEQCREMYEYEQSLLH